MADAQPAGTAPEADIVVSAESRAVAAELVALAREVTAALPFGVEPADYLAALERLAEDEAR
jgi:hypothetical protein